MVNKIRKTWVKIIAIVTLISLVVSTSFNSVYAESTSLNDEVSTTEVLIIENMSDHPNEKGFYEKNGYVVMNSTTKVTSKASYPILIEVQSVEDNYDLQGNYINTQVKHSVINNDFKLGVTRTEHQNRVLNSPVNESISVKDFIANNQVLEFVNLDNKKKSELSQEIQKTIDQMPVTLASVSEEKGLTYEEMDLLREQVKDIQLQFSSQESKNIMDNSLNVSVCPAVSNGVESCGAFDNYYRHNVNNGDFTAQVLGLSGEPNMYTSLHGNIGNYSGKASRLSTFKSYINTYERYVVDGLEYNKKMEALSWGGTIASMVLFYLTYSGPAGWVAMVLNSSNALTILIGITSSAYGTASRLTITKNTAQYQQYAIDQIYNMFNDANYGINYKPGF